MELLKKNIKRSFLGVMLLSVLLACENQEKNNSNITADIENLPKVDDGQNANKQGFWKVKSTQRYPSHPSDADSLSIQEVSKYLRFQYRNDSLQIGDCLIETYRFEQKTDAYRKDSEFDFISFYKPKKEKVHFISTLENPHETCFPFDAFLFYHPTPEQMIFLDRGYFFELEPVAQVSTTKFITHREGIPGNNRQEWLVQFEKEGIADANQALLFFQNEFPYGRKDLTRDFLKNPKGNDVQNLIDYRVTDDGIFIEKADPMGTITVELRIENQKLFGIYRFKLFDEEG